jgi:nitrate/nitrite transporter NarK
MPRSHCISHWDPEDRVAWEAGNKYIARRNLVWSVVAEHVGFSTWSIWSVMVLSSRRFRASLTDSRDKPIAPTPTPTTNPLRQ